MSQPKDTRSSAVAARLERVIESYEPLPGVFDECIDERGRIRPGWVDFFERFTALSASELDRRFASADRHMHDTGVSYRPYGETDERPWPLSRVPLLIGHEEWSKIASGVVQRARLAETLLADLHGPNRFVEGGHLAATAVSGSPDFLYPLQGIRPPGGRFLSLYAVDLGRGPDGRWWVLGDRTQAPSGAGYALENRLALSRAFADLYGAMNVERFAPFFQAFRSGLAEQAERVDPRICILTPGPLSETYFEHAYLARYLGFLLVEGGDLTVRDGQMHVRTIAGLKRADVLLRRIDADFADPLELTGGSRLGVPGFMEAVRNASVVVANALGSGLIEGRAIMSAMPGLAEAALGERLELPSIGTYWGGSDAGRSHIAGTMDRLMISGAHRERLAALGIERSTYGADLDAAQRALLLAHLDERGFDVAAQDVPRLSTTPVWDGHRFAPRPFVLRVFAAATRDGWRVMPGGFCRVAGSPDARTIAMGTGVQSADVWVLADAPVLATTLLPTSATIRIRRVLGNLPSRAADNLFWLGRYLERTEGTLRVVRCLCSRLIEAGGSSETSGNGVALGHLFGLLANWDAAPAIDGKQAIEVLVAALHDPGHDGSALCLAREVQRTASTLRERLSADTTRLVDVLVKQLLQPTTLSGGEAELYERADQALRAIAAISGLSQENMNRVAGWRFLDMGRRIERGVAICRFVQTFATERGPAASLDVLLDLIDSQITYRSRYLIGVALAPVRDMAMLDPFNPRSVAFQVERLAEHIEALPTMRRDGIPEIPNRLVLSLAAKIATAEAADLDGKATRAIGSDLFALGGAIADRFFLQGASAARADRFSGLE